jgi:hypothetical protein
MAHGPALRVLDRTPLGAFIMGPAPLDPREHAWGEWRRVWLERVNAELGEDALRRVEVAFLRDRATALGLKPSGLDALEAWMIDPTRTVGLTESLETLRRVQDRWCEGYGERMAQARALDRAYYDEAERWGPMTLPSPSMMLRKTIDRELGSAHPEYGLLLQTIKLLKGSLGDLLSGMSLGFSGLGERECLEVVRAELAPWILGLSDPVRTRVVQRGDAPAESQGA